MNRIYLETARMLTQVAPLVFVEDVFALKGGTAINLFVRDLPRISVDLDLVFTNHHLTREQALASTGEALRRSTERLNVQGFQTHLRTADDASETSLLVRRGGIEVKVEVNPVMRGTIHPVRQASLTELARKLFSRISRYRWYQMQTCMAANSSRPWTDSIPAICST